VVQDRSHALANLSGFGIETDEELVRHSDTNDLGRLACGPQALLEGDEVRFVAADHAGNDVQDFAHRSAASADGASTRQKTLPWASLTQ